MHDYLFCVSNNTILYYVIVISILIYLIWFSQNKFHDVGRHVTVNSEFPWTYSGESQEPELGGPRTVGDSFEPLGVFVIVTWTRPSHLTKQNSINRITKNTGVVNIMYYYSIKLYLHKTRINNSSEVVKFGVRLNDLFYWV